MICSLSEKSNSDRQPLFFQSIGGNRDVEVESGGCSAESVASAVCRSLTRLYLTVLAAMEGMRVKCEQLKKNMITRPISGGYHVFF